ncbi:hypothetical protein ACTFIV_001509 [Dictyostelium citrinum]
MIKFIFRFKKLRWSYEESLEDDFQVPSHGNNYTNPFIFSNNNNDKNILKITTPITEIIHKQPLTQTWGIGNYEKYHYIEPPLVVVLPPHPHVEHAPTNGSTTTVPAITTTASIPTIASITAPKPVTLNASPDPLPEKLFLLQYLHLQSQHYHHYLIEDPVDLEEGKL